MRRTQLPATFHFTHCLNCGDELGEHYNYCLACGAKVKESRFTLRRLLSEYSERFFSLDNTFARTFIDLFRKPEVVIDGFINGLRKRYMNPVSYFTIALTISGLQTFVIKNTFLMLSAMFTEWSNPILQ